MVQWCFHPLLRGLSSLECPLSEVSPSPKGQNFHAKCFLFQVVNRIINFIFSANDVAFSEDLLIAGNQCLMELSRCLQGHLASHSHQVAIFILRQLDDEELCSPRHASSIIKLLAQVSIKWDLRQRGSKLILQYVCTMYHIACCKM